MSHVLTFAAGVAATLFVEWWFLGLPIDWARNMVMRPRFLSRRYRARAPYGDSSESGGGFVSGGSLTP